MSQSILNNGESGANIRNKINDNFTEVYSSISSLGSGSPSGIYATLVDLETALPTGDANIYIVTATGNWYFWNGSAWTSGGTYQATGIADNSIDMGKLLNVLTTNESINKFNKATVTANSSINFGTGVPTVSSGNSLSDYIPVLGGFPYKKTSNTTFCWFDSGQVFISGAGTGTSITAPATAAYIRIVCSTANIGTEMLAFGWQDITTYQSYYDYKILNSALDKLNLEMEEIKTLNLINYSTMEFGVRYSTTDGTKTTGDFAWTDKITVVPCDYYTFRKGDAIGTSIIFFDVSDAFISSSTAVVVKAPSNASYMRLKINSLADFLKATILHGSHRLDYDLPEKQITIRTSNLNGYYRSKWYGKRWWVMGDSISTGDGITSAFATKPYHWHLAFERGIIVNSIATSGRTISGTNAADLNQQVTNGAMPDTANAPDLITIFAGTNDFGFNYVLGATSDTTAGTFYGGVNKLFTDLQTRFPKASIGVILPLPRSTNLANAIPLYLVSYVNALKDRAAVYNIPVLDLYTNGGLNFSNATVNTALSVSADGLHPNNDGHLILKGRIGNFIESL